MNGSDLMVVWPQLELLILLSVNLVILFMLKLKPSANTLEAGAVFGTVEAVKTVSDLFLPVSGTINELNPDLANCS